MKLPVYLDHAAATPLDARVQAVMEPYFSEKFYNPSAIYLGAKSIARDIADARAAAARVLGARPAEVIFTAGGTEANNLAIHGIMQAFPDADVLVSAIEHDSVLIPAQMYPSDTVAMHESGMLDLDELRRKITDKTVLVSVMYVNNEIGTIQPLGQIAEIIQAARQARKKAGNALPLYFHTDACQAGNYLHLLVDKLGVDLMTLNGGKIYGPKQSGVLYVRSGVQIRSQILGGGQERGIRSGTENVANIIGFSEALRLAQELRSTEVRRLAEIRKHFLDRLARQVPSAKVTSAAKQIVPNNIHLTIPDTDNERLMMALDEGGVMCAVGSACSASNDEPSHVLRAIGLTDDEARSSLRFTMGRGTSKQDIDHTIALLAKLIV